MASDVPDDLIEIHDPEIDPARILAEVRDRVRQRREALGYDRRAFPTFGGTDCPAEPEDIQYDPNLYHYLRLANESYAMPALEPLLPPSPASRLPVIGGLWQRVRPAMHQLILFYVNRAIGGQVNVNRHLVSVLNQLTALSAEQQRAIEALQTEVRALRSEREG